MDRDGRAKVAIASAGAIPHLVALLRATMSDSQRQAARALHNLTSKNTDNKNAVVEAGAIPRLLLLMKSGAPAVREQVVGVLRNLTGGGVKPENKAAVAEANAIPTLITVLKAVEPQVQMHIAVILYNLVNNSPCDDRLAHRRRPGSAERGRGHAASVNGWQPAVV
eukprot:CAMPEP_0176154400 /NCGR_PEP_ID=MMETSP0120_2-20121206/78882_1 /TAXON_ID=160619 /ORGANISM="Kryptoperidinium foliaceum, Strain CCMP 1326" /LENGTH=165 /DNA_ID=CAMNT_0017491497 /DNA_START=42 /DNA_END=536 /DNA_ORIENTATION=-